MAVKTITIRINHDDKTKSTGVNIEYSSSGVTEVEMKAAVCALSENFIQAMIFFNEQDNKIPLDKLIALCKRDIHQQLDSAISRIYQMKNLNPKEITLETPLNISTSFH